MVESQPSKLKSDSTLSQRFCFSQAYEVGLSAGVA